MKRIVVTVREDGSVAAETVGMSGSGCLDYIGVLEELLAARTVHSEHTREAAAQTTRAEQHDAR